MSRKTDDDELLASDAEANAGENGGGLAQDPQMQNDLQLLDGLQREARMLGQIEPSAQFVARVVAALPEARAQRASEVISDWLRGWIFAGALAATVVIVVVLQPGNDAELDESSIAALDQVSSASNIYEAAGTDEDEVSYLLFGNLDPSENEAL